MEEKDKLWLVYIWIVYDINLPPPRSWLSLLGKFQHSFVKFLGSYTTKYNKEQKYKHNTQPGCPLDTNGKIISSLYYRNLADKQKIYYSLTCCLLERYFFLPTIQYSYNKNVLANGEKILA